MQRPKEYARTTLRRRHRRVVRALADALVSPDGEVAPAELDALVERLDRFVSPASKTLRFGLLVMLDVLRWLPLFVIGRARAFEDLSRGDRTRMLVALDRSRITELTLIFVAYKTMLTVLFYESPAELLAMGYPGDAERHRFERALPVTTGATGATPTSAAERTP